MKLALLLPALLLCGCPGPVGTYRVDSSALLEASCNGVSPAASAAWADALTAAPAEDLAVGWRAGVVEAQLTRDDATALFAPIEETGDEVWSGTRSETAVTSAEGLLGADFSALLEADGVCRVNLAVEAELRFAEGGTDRLNATFRVTVSESEVVDGCDIGACSAAIAVGAAHVGRGNPGVLAPSEE